MNARFIITVLASGLMLAVSIGNWSKPTLSLADVFYWLGFLLVMALIALWPTSKAATRAEAEDFNTTWADRIDFKKSGSSN